MRIESRVYNRLQEPQIDIPRPTKIPTTEEMVELMNKAGREPGLVKELNEMALWRARSARKDIIFGGPGCGMCNEYGPHSH